MSTEEAMTRVMVAERCGGICEAGIEGVCLGRCSNMSHRTPRGLGGGWEPSNIMGLCGSGTTGCHGWIESHPAEAELLGLRVSSGAEVAAMPVRMRTAVWPMGWYLLDDDGAVTFISDWRGATLAW